MIAYLKGELIGVEEDRLIVEVAQVGYNVQISSKTASLLPHRGSQVQIYTYTCVREDSFTLFGFLSQGELSLFRLLVTVNGIGPKGALGILSAIGEEELKYAIIAGDDKLIAKAPGIGPKTAARVILELKNKITLEDISGLNESLQSTNEPGDSNELLSGSQYGQVKDEVMQALTALGYGGADIIKGMQEVQITEGMNTEVVLKLVLKKMVF